MNDWQKNFLEKVDVLRGASRDQFEHSSEQIVVQIFEDGVFVGKGGISDAGDVIQLPSLLTSKTYTALEAAIDSGCENVAVDGKVYSWSVYETDA